jgi:hypothetical protein
VLVPRERQLRAQGVDVEPRSLLQEERERREIFGRGEPVQRRRRRDDQDVALAARHVVQRGEPLRNEILVRRELVVRQRLPVGQQGHRSSGANHGSSSAIRCAPSASAATTASNRFCSTAAAQAERAAGRRPSRRRALRAPCDLPPASGGERGQRREHRMVVAGREVAGSAVLLPDAEAGASDAGAVPAAAGPPAGLSGGTCNCKTNADYK